jgi:hypothetical protein
MAIQLPFCVEPLALGTITTGNERANRLATHLDEEKDAGMVWQSNGNGNLWVRGDLGSAKAIDFVSLLAANAQPGTTIRVRLGDSQAEVDGTADYDSGALLLNSTSNTRDDGLYHSHLELPSVQTKQWWRIDIGGHTGDFEASTLVLGKKLTPARFYDRGHEYSIEDMGGLSFGTYGVLSEEDGIVLRALKFRLSWLTKTEWETLFRPIYERTGQRAFLFWCFDPEPTVNRQSETYFGPTIRTPAVVAGVKPGTFGLEFAITSPY